MPIYIKDINVLETHEASVANKMSSPYYRFDGVDDKITVANDANIDFGTGNFSAVFTMSWPQSTAGGGYCALIGTGALSWGNGHPAKSWAITHNDTTTNALRYLESTDAGGGWTSIIDILSGIPDGNHTIGFVRDITNSAVRAYVDGVEQYNSAYSADQELISQDFLIGGGNSYVSTQTSSVRLFNTALTAPEVRELYSGGSVAFKYKGANQTEQLTNASFATDTDWTKGTGWTIDTGTGKAVKAAGTAAFLYQDNILKEGKMYRLSMTISGWSAGAIRFQPGVSSGYFNADGTHIFDVVVTTGMFRLYADANFVASIDSVSAIQIGAVAEYDGSTAGQGQWKDKSGNSNHGTVNGATLENQPAYPVLQNLLTNSGFDVWSNSTLENVGSQLVTAWTNHGSYPYVPLTIDVADSNFIDFDALTNDGSLSYSWSNNILTPGKLYRIVVSGGTFGGNPQYFTTQTSGGANTYTINNVLADGTIVFEAGSTDVRVAIYGGAAVATNVFKMTIYEVTPGCVDADLLACDGWFKASGADIYRQERIDVGHASNTTNSKDGSYYSLYMDYTDNGDYVQWPLVTRRGLAEHYQRFAGRTVTFGCWAKTSSGSNAHLDMEDNTGAVATSSFHTGGGGWEWLECTATLGASITSFSVLVQGTGTTYTSAYDIYWSQPMLVFGNSIGEGNYTRPQGEVVWFEQGATEEVLTTYDGSNAISSNALINLEAESDGKIPKGVKAINVLMYGESATVEGYVGLSIKDDWIGMNQMFAQVANQLASIGFWQPCNSDGDVYIRRNQTFNNVRIKIGGVQLR